MPRSLLGQVMLVLALGLLAAQAISGVLLFRADQDRRASAMVGGLIYRFMASDASGEIAERRAKREAVPIADRLDSGEERPFDGRRFRRWIEITPVAPVPDGERRLPRFEREFRSGLEQEGFNAHAVQVTWRLVSADPWLAERQRGSGGLRRMREPGRRVLVAGIQLQPGGKWTVVRMIERQAPRRVLGSIIFQTLVIFFVLFGLLYVVLRRLTRPLAQLTSRLGDFASSPDKAVVLEERGPEDMRRLIAAHNAMEARIAAMLDEKDVMLGAIGHDLKTPLAALRVRTESMPDEVQRARMADSIEDITRTLDDILNLARVGRASDPKEPTDLAALVASLVEEYEDMGEPVELRAHRKLVAPLRTTWLKRAVRNLIGNALRYGGAAKVDVEREGDMAVIRIEDEGPGIPEGQIADMLEPFRRGETSRNRATGGSGLGLTLARAIAEQHGGSLSLANRPEGGLRAEIRVPV